MDVHYSDQAVRRRRMITFDYIFMDPPYNKGFEDEVLAVTEIDSSICTARYGRDRRVIT